MLDNRGGEILRVLSEIKEAGSAFYKAPAKLLNKIADIKTRQGDTLSGLVASAIESDSVSTDQLDEIIAELNVLAQSMAIIDEPEPVSVSELPGG